MLKEAGKLSLKCVIVSRFAQTTTSLLIKLRFSWNKINFQLLLLSFKTPSNLAKQKHHNRSHKGSKAFSSMFHCFHALTEKNVCCRGSLFFSNFSHIYFRRFLMLQEAFLLHFFFFVKEKLVLIFFLYNILLKSDQMTAFSSKFINKTYKKRH